jgi:hypothetical protein
MTPFGVMGDVGSLVSLFGKDYKAHNEPLRRKEREDFVFLPNPLAADQLFRKILAFIAREKVKRDPDKGLVIHIPVFDQFDKPVR